jgi:hypothetical protein
LLRTLFWGTLPYILNAFWSASLMDEMSTLFILWGFILGRELDVGDREERMRRAEEDGGVRKSSLLSGLED